ncbi:HGxxPAAW family protein [Amycolatopsis sp.]|uniref:HGxxPAAW family protein n=1 Tax=Amycolatopsis sp. TaxID=37632 RepID=UPI002C0645FD|nr:HGxxPAAW family protein [Amycolatopsis sp.]HVV13694.1 HGxxPAAW family protein [Amycolatopsis sp.]HVW80408.1 HGxxPAAW family protein [Mycobacteriales bacterium]
MAGQSGGHNASLAIWLTVYVAIAGTIVGGIALIYWNWPLFWVGIGLFVLGCLAGYFAGIMEAVSEFGAATDSK